MKLILNLILAWIFLAITASSNDDTLRKIMSAKKPPGPSVISDAIGTYKNYLVGAVNNFIFLVDIDTRRVVKSILGILVEST
jgi:hypothetical protein